MAPPRGASPSRSPTISSCRSATSASAKAIDDLVPFSPEEYVRRAVRREVVSERRRTFMDDAHYMRKALALAERGRGRTSPNPMVGALVVDDDGVIVGRGAHQAAGGPHAEVIALEDAGRRRAGATLYCTLEPCSHIGRTGPCAPAVVRGRHPPRRDRDRGSQSARRRPRAGLPARARRRGDGRRRGGGGGAAERGLPHHDAPGPAARDPEGGGQPRRHDCRRGPGAGRG